MKYIIIESNKPSQIKQIKSTKMLCRVDFSVCIACISVLSYYRTVDLGHERGHAAPPPSFFALARSQLPRVLGRAFPLGAGARAPLRMLDCR